MIKASILLTLVRFYRIILKSSMDIVWEFHFPRATHNSTMIKLYAILGQPSYMYRKSNKIFQSDTVWCIKAKLLSFVYRWNGSTIFCWQFNLFSISNVLSQRTIFANKCNKVSRKLQLCTWQYNLWKSVRASLQMKSNGHILELATSYTLYESTVSMS